MIVLLEKLRYISLFLLLVASFSMLSLSQAGPSWELSSDALDKGRILQIAIFILFLCELVMIFMDIFLKKDIINYYVIVHIICLLFCLFVYLFGFDQMMINLRETHSYLSKLIAHPWFFGFPISIVLVLILTYRRLK